MSGLRFRKGLENLMSPISALRPSPGNPNNGDVDAVVASMLRWGVYAPIIANEDSGEIIAGHTRYLALLELGAKMAPIIYTSADDTEHLGMLMADNKTARLARMDESLEMDAMRRLAESDKGLAGTGYNEGEMEKMAARLMKQESEPLNINLGGGRENLIHTITCPNCNYEWVRGQGQED